MFRSYRLQGGMNLVRANRLKSGESADRLRSWLQQGGDLERARRAMVSLQGGPVEGMSDEAVLDALTDLVGQGPMALQGRSGSETPPSAPPRQPMPVPDAADLENPFTLTKRDSMALRAYGVLIGGAHMAHDHWQQVVAGHSAEVDPDADPEDERHRLLREGRERIAARLRGAALTREYQRDIQSVLLQIRSSATGRAVLDQIQRHTARNPITIEPYVLVDGETRGGYSVATPRVGERDRRFGPKPALIRFTPEQWRRKLKPISLFLLAVWGIDIEGRWGIDNEWGPGTQPDEVLLHELVHAYFTVSGSKFRRRVPFQGRRYLTDSRDPHKHPHRRGPNEMDEFMAIMITNIYHSELGRDKIRHSHVGFEPHDLSAEAFLKIGLNRAHIRLLRRKQPRLFNDLNDVEAPWNPLRHFWDSPRG